MKKNWNHYEVGWTWCYTEQLPLHVIYGLSLDDLQLIQSNILHSALDASMLSSDVLATFP
jgi:hypothetical protein